MQGVRQREMTSSSNALSSLLTCVGLLALAVFVTAYNRSERASVGSLSAVDGSIKEWSRMGSESRPLAVRLSIVGQPFDFRIDPKVVSALLPADKIQLLRKGAQAHMLTPTRQLAQPFHPVIGADAAIVWVYGLSIDRQELFSPADVSRAEQGDDYWGYALIVLSALGCCYFGWRWVCAKRAT
jgi:hypothetical protein